VASAQIALERRDDRWSVALPGERMAWFPASDAARRRMAVERDVLRLLAARCTYRVPRVLHEADSGFDVRALVPGWCDPWAAYERLAGDRALARCVGGALGLALAEQHTRVHRADVAGWLPERVCWPEPDDWIRARLPQVVTDRGLLASIEATLARCAAVRVDADDRVLIHGDLGLHNIALDPATCALRGIFDYDSAAWADRHFDFRYLIFDHGAPDMLEAAIAAYEPAVGRRIDRSRVRLYNAACAISYLAFRRGVEPEEQSCGRTLAQDLAWVGFALDEARGE
jgi:aminoglycoside phosphotransferase (APT) family kinase protein